MRLLLLIIVTVLLVVYCRGATVPAVERPREFTLTAAQIFARIIEANALQEQCLPAYSARRTFTVIKEGKIVATAQTIMEFSPPNIKKFRTVSATGSKLVLNRVIKLIQEAENKTAFGQAKLESAFCPENYNLELIGCEICDGYLCYKMKVIPIAKKKRYLFNGWVWVLKNEFIVIRAEGSPVVLPSFWLSSVNFMRSYQDVKKFWLPRQDQVECKIKLFGKYSVKVDYDQYQLRCP